MPSLGLNSQKKQLSHTASLHCCIYEGREIISKTSFTIKEKLEIVALKSLSISISSYKDKNKIRSSILEKK
jgi:hypothetical protein